MQEIIARSKGDAPGSALNILETACQVRLGEPGKPHPSKPGAFRNLQDISISTTIRKRIIITIPFRRSSRARGGDPMQHFSGWRSRSMEEPAVHCPPVWSSSRRKVSQDSDPQALLVAVSAFHATEVIGLPEAQNHLPLKPPLYMPAHPKQQQQSSNRPGSWIMFVNCRRSRYPAHCR